MLRVGERIEERFEVEALIGQGGLAEVYRVRHVDLGSVHALKLLVWRKKSLTERLILEGKIQAQLRHPNVVAVTDLIRHEGRTGLLMEFVDHMTLEDWLQRNTKADVDTGLTLMAPIIAGVLAAHDVGVLHRDLKPANVMLARSANGLVPKVADFGIAKVVSDGMEGQTKAGVTMGTPGYLAPEQVKDSADTDARADIFALGVMTYELLCGYQPFANDRGEVSVQSTLSVTPVPLGERAQVPEHVAAAVMKSIARDRDTRFATLREFAEALYAEHPSLLAQVGGQEAGAPLALNTIERTTTQETFMPDSGTLMPASSAGETLMPGPVTSESRTIVEHKLSPGLLAVSGLLGVLLVGAIGVGAVVALRPDPPVAPAEIEAEPAAEVEAPSEAPAAPEEPAVASAEPEVADAGEAPEPAPAPVEEGVDGPSEAPTTADAPVPEPAEAPPEETEAEVVDATAEEEAPAVAEVTPEPEPEPVAPPAPKFELGGSWSGRANNLPVTFEFDEVAGGKTKATATLVQGPTQRRLMLAGTFDDQTGAVKLEGDGFVFTGQVRGATLSGTYTSGRGNKVLGWQVTQ